MKVKRNKKIKINENEDSTDNAIHASIHPNDTTGMDKTDSDSGDSGMMPDDAMDENLEESIRNISLKILKRVK